MKELVKHIEILLLDHDCVVVPQIGGFVTCNAPAKYVEDENLFLPPIRTVGFNERLKADDGLLVRSYVEAYGCSDIEARTMLGEQIRDLQQDLWEAGTYDLGSIGVLMLDERNNVGFSPCQAGTVCPAYYGLDALLFEPLLAEKTVEAPLAVEVSRTVPERKPETVTVESEPVARGEITIRLKTAWLQNIAAVAAVVLLFFLMSPDAKNTGVSSASQAEFARLMWMPAVQETVPEAFNKPEEIQVKGSGTGVESPVSAAVQPETVQKAAVSVAVESGFCVVVASAIPEKNAKAYVERLHKEGYKEAQVYKKGNMVRVVFPGFASEAEAHAKMNALSDRSEEFAYAWVYQIK